MDKKTYKPRPKTGNKWEKAGKILIYVATVLISIATADKVKIKNKS